MEHPASPTWKPAAPSIFYLAVMRWLMECPVISVIRFLQGWHGQISAKPTMVMVLRLPQAKENLFKKHGHQPDRQRVQLTGRNEKGEWQTAAAKEYTDSMNKAIALSFLQAFDNSVQVMPPAESDPVPDLDQMFSSYYVQHDRYDPEQANNVMGQDFARLNRRSML